MDRVNFSAKTLTTSLIVLVLIGGIYASGVNPGQVSTDNGMVAEYRFDTGAGDTAYDTAGSNDGTINGAKWVNGERTALSFDGSSNVDISSASSKFDSNSLTVSAIVKPDSGGWIIGNGARHRMSIDGNGVTWWIRSEEDWNSNTVSGGDIASGQWYHVVGTYNSDTGVQRLYVNGNLVGEGNPGFTIREGHDNQVIGGSYGDDTSYDGSIDSTKIYSEALNSSQIRSLHNSGSWRIGSATEEDDPSKVLDMSFQHVQSGQVLDTSGNNNHGTIENGASQVGAVECKVGRCFRFDGSDDYVSVSHDSGLDIGSGDLTSSAWVKIPEDYSPSNHRIILEKTVNEHFHTSDGPGWGISIDNGGNIYGGVTDSSGSNKWETSQLTDIRDGEWHHVVLAIDNGNDVSLYLDGQLEDSASLPSVDQSTSVPLGIGASADSQTRNVEAAIDEVKVYDKLLSEDEIWQIYSGGRNRQNGMAGPVANYPMQTESAPLRDVSGEGNHGALNLLGESGTFETSDGEWKTIRFERSYEDPIVVGTTNTHNGDHAIYFETKNVGSSSASMRLCESEGGNSDGCDTHGTERAGYVVIDAAATDEIPGIEAGSLNVDSEIDSHTESISYSESFGSTPMVFTQVMTDNGEGEVESWVPSSGTSGFDVGICQQDSTDGCDPNHPEEEIGWIAVEPGNEPFEQPGEANQLGSESSTWESTSFSSSFSSRPVGVFGVQNNDGGQDPKVDEIRNIDTSGMEMRFCEIDTGDGCNGHANMEYAYMAVSEGLLTYSTGNFPRYVDTSRGKALEFDGSDDYVEVPAGNNLNDNLGSSYTLTAWVYPTGDSSANNPGILVKGPKNANGQIQMEYREGSSDRKVRFLYEYQNGDKSYFDSSSGDVPLNQWTHITFKMNSTGRYIYVNGNLENSDTSDTVQEYGGYNWYIGQKGGSYFGGKIDNVRIYPYALNQQQIKKVMNSGSVTIG